MAVSRRDPRTALPPALRTRLRNAAPPDWLEPMLATLTHEPFSSEEWIFEPKFDGERCLAFRRGNMLHLFSRNRKPLNGSYPELLDPLLAQAPESFVVDGEVVTFEGGVTSFARLQQRMQIQDPEQARRTGIPVWFYLFDLLYLEGCDARMVPLRWRKRLLEAAFRFQDPLRFTGHREKDGEAYYREACRQGWEGLIAKRAESAYAGGRSRDWLKFKCVNEQEFVIGGYTDPQGSRVGFGALLVGYYQAGKLTYAGKVGTGYANDTLQRLTKRLRALESETCPFSVNGLPRHGVHWVRPELVAQIGFTEWTVDGKLRHPRFLGLRDDKPAKEVVREQ